MAYKPDYCSILSNNDIPDNLIDSLRDKDDVAFIYRKYIRKIYKDLTDYYPVNEIATYGFDGILSISPNDKTLKEANELIESIGLVIIPSHSEMKQYASVPKELDFISVANELHESGLFNFVLPSRIIGTKALSAQPIDKVSLPYYYNSNGSKSYWYELSDRFLIRKNPSISKSSLETIINEQVKESEIIWENDSICTVITYQGQVDAAMEALSDRDEVLRISHKYFDVSEYEFVLEQGYKTPQSFGLTGEIELS